MREVRLNLLDDKRTFTGIIDVAFGEALVAALSAEPVNVRELQGAVARFHKKGASSHLFSSLSAGFNDEPWDAGILIIDFPSHTVAQEIVGSSPIPSGTIQYHNGASMTDAWISYRIPDDWLYLGTILEYRAIAEARRAKYEKIVPLDARSVLYGRVADFIVRQCLEARGLKLNDPIATIHANWLMTPRQDLNNQTPRQVLLNKFDFITADLHSREMQWSMLNAPAPGLNTDSHAYRYAGFGVHEFVVYYHLVRSLIEDCWKSIGNTKTIDLDAEIKRLRKVQTNWLEAPESDFGNRNPAYVLECERKRLPLIMSAEELEIEDDCPLCKMMADHPRPTFWHLDGSGMDDDFPFSFCLTRDEWESENRRRDKLTADFERHWKHRKDTFFEDDDPSQSGSAAEIQ
jgi:hypothetical protein